MQYLRYYLLIFLILLAAAGCSEAINVGNAVATIKSVDNISRLEAGSLGAQTAQVAIDYTIIDSEGDDQDISVIICHDDSQFCGYPLQGPGSDGTVALPVLSNAEDTPHRFVWKVGCSRLADGVQIPADLDQNYIVKLSIIDDKAQIETESQPFNLKTLGFSNIPECP